MARPVKNNCEYFPHDRDMRNHRKIKAIRTKHGAVGYAIWVMILEYLTGQDGNCFEYSDMEFELMSGDFGVSVTEIEDIVSYCIKLQLLFNKDGFISSESLDERLAPVYLKRNKAKGLSKQQLRVSGKFDSGNTDSSVVSVTEMPQSKVKESKLKETILNSDKEIFEKLKFDLFNSPSWLEDISRNNNIQIQKVKMYLNDFCKKLEDEQDYFKELKEQKKHFVNWMKIQINKPTSKFAPAETPKRLDYSIADLNKKPLKD